MFAYNGKNQVETLWERFNQFVPDKSKSSTSDSGEGGGEADADDEEEELDDGGTGAILQAALSNHTKMIDVLLANGADESIKDKEGHAARDFDYHPEADAEVLDAEREAEKKREDSHNEL